MITRLFVLVTLYLLVVTNVCNSMEQFTKHQQEIVGQIQKDCSAKNINFIQSTILRKLTSQESHPQAEFLTNNKIIVADFNKCHFINLATAEKTLLQDKTFTNLIVHPNKKKFALFFGNTIGIYNTQTKLKIETFTLPDTIHLAVFKPSSDTILVCDKTNLITECNYTTNQSYPLTLPTKCDISPINPPLDPKILNIAMHPTKNQLLLGYRNGYISVHNLDNNSEVKKIITAPLKEYFCIPRFLSYCNNGSLIANCSANHLYLVNPHSGETSVSYELGGEYFRAVAFHPNNAVIAGLIAPHNYVAYMGTKQKHYICMMSPLFGGISLQYSDIFSFSPNGKKLIITLENTSFIVEVPFEALYQDDTKKRLPHLLFLLNNMNNNFPVTMDVITLFKHFLINVFER